MVSAAQIWGWKKGSCVKRYCKKVNPIPQTLTYAEAFFTSLVAGGGNNVSLYFIIAFGQASMNRNDANFFWVDFAVRWKVCCKKMLKKRKGYGAHSALGDGHFVF